MLDEKFKIYFEGVFIRLAIIALGMVLNFRLNDNIFKWSIFALGCVILTLLQGLVEKVYLKVISYIMILVISIYFYSVNINAGTIAIICLIAELVFNSRYLAKFYILALGFFFVVSTNHKDALIYFILGWMDIIILRQFYKSRESFNKKSVAEEYLKEDLYISKNKHLKEKELNRQRVTIAKLEERNKIGREMHDKIGHVLAGSIMRLEAAKIVLNIDKEKGNKMIDESINNLRDGMNDIRGIIHKITPKSNEIGIQKIKEEMLEKFKDTDIKVHIITEGDLRRVSINNWMIFERVCRELSTNMIKYSRGKNIQIKINVFNKVITLSFSDDGIGCEDFNMGFGLRKIEEEIVLNKGHLIINSIEGFQVIVTIKID